MKKIFILLLVFSTLFSQAQTSYGDYKDAADLCIAMQGNSFSSDKDADNALDRILSAIGASKRFILQSCSNVDNASAISSKGIRYILYNKEFMNELNSNLNSWSSLSVLAHEVGHHINGHTLDWVLYAVDMVDKESLAEQRQQELEADEFSGFIMAKLGASLDQASEVMANYSPNGDDSYSNHPSRDKRLNAIQTGYNKGNTNNRPIAYEAPTTLSAKDYLYRGIDKQSKGDFNGALTDFTKAIEIDPNLYDASLNRGVAKDDLDNYYGAIADFTTAIEIDPNYASAYYNRGLTKGNLENDYGAIADFTKAIEIDISFALAYYGRGIAKHNLDDYYGAIKDYRNAIRFNPNYANAYFARGKTKFILTDNKGAIADYTKGIEIEPNNAEAYYFRGAAKGELENDYGAIADYTKAIVINHSDGDFYVGRGLSKSNIGDCLGALADYTKAIELNPNDADAYHDRGLIKEGCGDLSGACSDWRQAANLGDEDAAQWVRDDCN